MDEQRDPRDGVPLVVYLHPNAARPANPNTPEGEIQSVSAFAAGVHRASPSRRAAAKIIVWLILIGMVLSILAAVAHGIHGA